MLFRLEKASDLNYQDTIYIEDLDDLYHLHETLLKTPIHDYFDKGLLVIDFYSRIITIYDDYIE